MPRERHIAPIAKPILAEASRVHDVDTRRGEESVGPAIVRLAC